MAKWERLVAARERMHLSQVEAAEHLNVGLVTYQRWEAGRRKPQPHHMRQVHEVFGMMPDHFSVEPTQKNRVDASCTASAIEDLSEGKQIVVPAEEINELHTFIAANMTTHLWSLAFMDHATCYDKRGAIRQAIKEFDSMNTDNKNYQMTRREAVWSLATLPVIALGLTTAGKSIPSHQYGSALAHCSASLEACWELSKSSDATDLSLAFQSVSKYLPILEEITRASSQYRKEALDLATRYALLKTILGWHCVGPTQTIQYARDAVILSQGSGDISLQLSAYSKLAWAYLYDRKYNFAYKTAQEAEYLLQQHSHQIQTPPLHPCILGGIYSTLAVMQAKNGKLPDVVLGKASETNPGDEVSAFMDFTRSTMLLETSWAYCYSGNQEKAIETLAQRIDPETLLPVIPQSEIGRVETLNIMTLSSLRTKKRDLEKTIHFWIADIEGAKALQSEWAFNDAAITYELMETIWPDEKRIADLRDHIVHWE